MCVPRWYRQQSVNLDLASECCVRKRTCKVSFEALQAFWGLLLLSKELTLFCFHRTLSSFGNKPKVSCLDFYFFPFPIFIFSLHPLYSSKNSMLRLKGFDGREKKTKPSFFFPPRWKMWAVKKQDFVCICLLIMTAPYHSQQAHTLFIRKKKKVIESLK